MQKQSASNLIVLHLYILPAYALQPLLDDLSGHCLRSRESWCSPPRETWASVGFRVRGSRLRFPEVQGPSWGNERGTRQRPNATWFSGTPPGDPAVSYKTEESRKKACDFGLQTRIKLPGYSDWAFEKLAVLRVSTQGTCHVSPCHAYLQSYHKVDSR